MRTTLTIDDDLAGLLKRRARELDKPFKEVVNAALRRGLAEGSGESPRPTVRVRPHDFGATRQGVDSCFFNRLSDELEVEDFLANAAKDDSGDDSA